mgnify:FL=1
MSPEMLALAFKKFEETFSGGKDGGTKFQYGQGATSTSPKINHNSMIQFIQGSQPRPPQYGLLNNRIANARKRQFGLLSDRVRGLLG